MLKSTEMDAKQIRNEYLKFYKDRGHTIIPRSKLTPENDPTTLFTGSGMQPLLPYLLGEPHPEGIRLVNSQPCLRAQDTEDVGDNRHTTFFEMLGNWSLGDYFKQEQIGYIFEFLTETIKLNPKKLYVTCFVGYSEDKIPIDDDSARWWQEQFGRINVDKEIVEIGSVEDGGTKGMQGGRIFYYNASKNWWSRAGEPNNMPAGEPGGPDSEIFYRFADDEHTESEKKLYGEHCHPNCECGRFIEIGNSVFMQYIKRDDGTFGPLPKQNVDFGGGLERIAAAAIDNSDIYRISLMWPIIEKLQNISGKNYESHTESMRVIVDHLRAATFLAVDDLVPSNKEQGYVMRRFLRRAIRFAFELGIEQNFLSEIVPVIADLYADDYPEVKEKRDEVITILIKEEKVFRQTLKRGEKELQKIFSRIINENDEELSKQTTNTVFGSAMGSVNLTGEDVFMMYDTYGYPVELTLEAAFREPMIPIFDPQQIIDSFNVKMTEQRERSRTATKGVFKGGLEGQSEMHTKYHTAAHLLGQALRNVLGENVVQKGCNINEERIRFDFSWSEKVTPEQIKQIEDIVNDQITKDLKVSCAEYPIKVAREELKAFGEFGDKYGDVVKVYKISADGDEKPFSLEICGGPHVDRTGELAEGQKKFKITKEESSSAGVRRIKAALI